MLIIGIDPGTNYTGWGLLSVEGRTARCEALGYIELHKMSDPYDKLRHIFERVAALIDEWHPAEAAFESPFFGENVQSMLKLGRAQGVAMAAALTRGVPVFEYAPRRIKQSITGNGAASKEQVAAMLRSMLHVEYSMKKLDATDGLAVALCHHFERSSPLAGLAGGSDGSPSNALRGGLGSSRTRGKAMSWGDFLAKNPDRGKK